MKRALWICLLLPLSACEWTGRQADALGEYMPVITDDRCENWQCFTSEGKARSEMIRKQREAQEQKAQQASQPGAAQPQQPAGTQPVILQPIQPSADPDSSGYYGQ